MTDELKPLPCPFCGSPAVCCWDASYSIKTQYWARCTNCCSKGAIRESEEEAVAAWNRRAEPEELPEWVKVWCRKQLSEYKSWFAGKGLPESYCNGEMKLLFEMLELRQGEL